MTKRGQLEVELSEKRSAINALLGKDELTADERGELETLAKRVQEAEVEFRAAVVAEGDNPPVETRAGERAAAELADLTARANAGEVFMAALERRAVAACPGRLRTGVPAPSLRLRDHPPVDARLQMADQLRPFRADELAPRERRTALPRLLPFG